MNIKAQLTHQTARVVGGLAVTAAILFNMHLFFYVEGGIPQWVAIVNGVLGSCLAYAWLEKDIELSITRKYCRALIEGDLKITRNNSKFTVTFKDGHTRTFDVMDMVE